MLLAENCDEIEGIIKLVDQLGVEYRASMSLIYRNDGSASPLNHFVGNKENIKNILRIIRKNMFSIDQPIDNPKNSEYMCGAGVTSICLSPDGTIYPCVSLKIPLGNLKTDSLSDVWNSTARSHIVTSLKWDNTTECKFCTRKIYVHIVLVCPKLKPEICFLVTHVIRLYPNAFLNYKKISLRFLYRG